MSNIFTKAQRDAQKIELRQALSSATKRNGKPIIYTILRRVSPSGMSRMISPVVINAETGEVQALAWTYERATSGRMPAEVFGKWANKVGGCGMDMGFHLAYCIAGAADIALQDFVHEWL